MAIVPRLEGHPHIWIDSRVEIILDGARISALRVHWTFDPFFTEMIVLDYGAPSDGTFSDAQISAIEQGAFQNLRHFDYFTMIRVDGREIPVERVERFFAYIDEDDSLVYQFEIPLDVDLNIRSRRLAISMYDESFFTDILFGDDYATVRRAERVRYRSELTREIYQVPIWGPMSRETVLVEFHPRE